MKEILIETCYFSRKYTYEDIERSHRSWFKIMTGFGLHSFVIAIAILAMPPSIGIFSGFMSLFFLTVWAISEIFSYKSAESEIRRFGTTKDIMILESWLSYAKSGDSELNHYIHLVAGCFGWVFLGFVLLWIVLTAESLSC